MTDTQPELGPVGQGIVYENDRVRVWHLRRDPGAADMLTNVGDTTYLARLVELK